MTNENHFSKTLNQWEFDYALFTSLPIIIIARDNSFRVHWNSKEVSYLSWQNAYPKLNTTCHIKLNFFLWTKLLQNLLLAKYLISVAAPLTKHDFLYLCFDLKCKCIDNIKYKMYLQHEKMAKLLVFDDFSNKRRFEQIYQTSLQNETVR